MLSPSYSVTGGDARFFLQQQGFISPVRLQLQMFGASGKPVTYRDALTFAQSHLERFPNKEAFWEVLNNSLVRALLERYPDVARVESDFEISSSPNISMHRASTVAQTRGGPLEESFRYLVKHLQVSGRVYDLEMRYRYKPGLTSYPDYLDIYDFAVASLSSSGRLETAADLSRAIETMLTAVKQRFGGLDDVTLDVRLPRGSDGFDLRRVTAA